MRNAASLGEVGANSTRLLGYFGVIAGRRKGVWGGEALERLETGSFQNQPAWKPRK
jgi:hypothetical protein